MSKNKQFHFSFPFLRIIQPKSYLHHIFFSHFFSFFLLSGGGRLCFNHIITVSLKECLRLSVETHLLYLPTFKKFSIFVTFFSLFTPCFFRNLQHKRINLNQRSLNKYDLFNNNHKTSKRQSQSCLFITQTAQICFLCLILHIYITYLDFYVLTIGVRFFAKRQN